MMRMLMLMDGSLSIFVQQKGGGDWIGRLFGCMSREEE
jgi:hypothetical protein